MPSMQRVNIIKSVSPKQAGFVNNINKDIDELNKLIDAYNKTTSHEKCIEKLKDILRYKQLIENKYSSNYVNDSEEYAIEIQNKLFLAIKAEFVQYGISNLYGIVDPTVSPIANTLSELLTNMEPERVNRLIEILSEGSGFNIVELNKLYSPDSNLMFETFLVNNAISYLGGGNSKNFKITPSNGSPPYVLKIEDRMGMPKLPVVHLKENSLKDTLTPVMAERQGTVNLSTGVRITRSILTTEFCSGGDLMAHSEKQLNFVEPRIDAALNIYDQMLHTLIGISNDGCAFPDMKNTNWLVDKKGKLLLADTKAFVFCEPDRGINYDNITKATGGNFVQTTYLNPPEFYLEFPKKAPISADKMHSYMFGKNLYQYLTNCNNDVLEDMKDRSTINFNYPIFKTDRGKKLMELIQESVQEKPNARISLVDAKLKLSSLKSPINSALIKDNLDILNNISSYGLGKNDNEMKNFITQQKELIASAHDPKELEAIKVELQSILNQLKASDEVKTVIANFREQASVFTIGMKDKADRIEQAMCNIPIKERGRIGDKDYKPGLQVLSAIASHRHFASFRSVNVHNNEIDAKTAAKTYNAFKEKLNQIKSTISEPNESLENTNDVSPKR